MSKRSDEENNQVVGAKRTGLKIAASVLSADLTRLGEKIAEVEQAGVDWIHVDVMDGVFVPPLTVGAGFVAACRRSTGLPLDVHLLVDKPERMIEEFQAAGADWLTVHAEACDDLPTTLQRIRKAGMKPGIAINPETSLSVIAEVLHLAAMIVVMFVNPNFPGLTYTEEMLARLACMRSMLDEKGLRAELQADGGMNKKSVPLAAAAGVSVVVSGSAIFKAEAGIAENVEQIRNAMGGSTVVR